ncbi:phage tail protein [Nocardia arthritidis]|uniref:Phage tail protein n=1 Tax=Nocardia arthritidis TaxID=228602 RepID=A0A6G9YTR7_9NOCA|nr:phage tail protein [Nocardia arthritidis]QIS16406.1 phage tail protein [Nocardia arthritidis]
MTTVKTIDFDAEYAAIVARLEANRIKRLRPPLIRLWDGNWVLRGQVAHTYSGSFQEIDSETGTGKIEMPEDYYLSKWVIDHDSRSTKNIHVTVDKDGVRWSGRMDSYEIDKSANGHTVVRVLFKHDYEELKHIICWSNPFLLAEIQFPRLWIMFGPAKWALKLTLLLNIMRLESSLWMLPDDPLDPKQWFNFDQSTWSMVVKPLKIQDDNSPFAVVHSRFKDFHTVAKRILADGQLTPTFRRYLDGDDPPWPGAKLKHGCLVIDIEDKSGWITGTSFGGDLFTGLVRAATNIAGDGMTEGTRIIDDPAFPDEYYQPGWKGTLPSAPGIVYRETKHNGIVSSGFIARPATDVQVVTGGHSMPGVNELISAAIQMAGDMIAMMIGVPPVGGAADALLKPLYNDTVLAWMAWKSPARAQQLGWSHYKEGLASAGDKAYTLSALISLRAKLWATREQFSHRVQIADGAPWLVGQRGKGHFYVGDRIGTTVKGAPKGKIYVERVSEATLSWSREKSPSWMITVGHREERDPVVKALEMIQELFGIAHDLGVM